MVGIEIDGYCWDVSNLCCGTPTNQDNDNTTSTKADEQRHYRRPKRSSYSMYPLESELPPTMVNLDELFAKVKASENTRSSRHTEDYNEYETENDHDDYNDRQDQYRHYHHRRRRRSSSSSSSRGCVNPDDYYNDRNYQRLPQEVEVFPGTFMKLRGSKETWDALRVGDVEEAYCSDCSSRLMCIYGAELVLCPRCSSVSPVVGDPMRRRGLGLGMNFEDAIKELERYGFPLDVYCQDPEPIRIHMRR